MVTTSSTPAFDPATLPGAVSGEVDGAPVILHYRDPAEEARAIRESCALVDRSWMGGFELTGKDRQRFLNAYVTCDLKDLPAGQGRFGFVTSAQGRILASVTVLALEDRLSVELPPGTSVSITEHLRRFVIADRVEFAPASPRKLSVVGPRASQLVAEVMDGLPPEVDGAHVAGTVFGVAARIERGPLLGPPAFTLWFDPSSTGAVFSGFAERGVALAGFAAAEVVRVEWGVPRFGAEYGPQNFPQETGLDAAVSYTKGCYLGQEVVARIHYRGGVQRVLSGLRFGEEVPSGTPLLFEGREAGKVGSAVHSDRLGWIGLAILHRRAATPGCVLEWSAAGRQGTAEVSSLPLTEVR